MKNNTLNSINTKLPDTVAYTMSRFPKLTETFILYEMIALEEAGVKVELFPLLKENQDVHHSEVAKWIERAHFYPFISAPIIFANLQWLFTHPIKYLSAIFQIIWGNKSSKKFLIRAIGLIPKASKMALEMQKKNVKHLHAHFCTHPATAAFLINKLTDIPYSFTAHGSDLHVDRTFLNRKVKTAKRSVTISQFNKQVMIDECGDWASEKIDVVHCGVDPELFKCYDRNRDADAPFQILCVASYEEVKGHKYLVEACELLKKRNIPFHTHLVGYGPLREAVESQIQSLNLSDNFTIYGGQPRDKVLEMHKLADVLVLPSVPTSNGKKEGIPVVLMEGMSSCLPVISSRISGIPELVKNDEWGILTEPCDVVALADAFEKLYKNPDLRRKMGVAGRQFIMEAFDLKKNARKLTSVFSV